MAEEWNDRDELLVTLPVAKNVPISMFHWGNMAQDLPFTLNNEGSGESRNASRGNPIHLGETSADSKFWNGQQLVSTVVTAKDSRALTQHITVVSEAAAAIKDPWNKFTWFALTAVHRSLVSRSAFLNSAKGDNTQTITDFGAVDGIVIGGASITTGDFVGVNAITSIVVNLGLKQCGEGI